MSSVKSEKIFEKCLEFLGGGFTGLPPPEVPWWDALPLACDVQLLPARGPDRGDDDNDDDDEGIGPRRCRNMMHDEWHGRMNRIWHMTCGLHTRRFQNTAHYTDNNWACSCCIPAKLLCIYSILRLAVWMDISWTSSSSCCCCPSWGGCPHTRHALWLLSLRCSLKCASFNWDYRRLVRRGLKTLFNIQWRLDLKNLLNFDVCVV